MQTDPLGARKARWVAPCRSAPLPGHCWHFWVQLLASYVQPSTAAPAPVPPRAGRPPEPFLSPVPRCSRPVLRDGGAALAPPHRGGAGSRRTPCAASGAAAPSAPARRAAGSAAPGPAAPSPRCGRPWLRRDARRPGAWQRFTWFSARLPIGPAGTPPLPPVEYFLTSYWPLS